MTIQPSVETKGKHKGIVSQCSAGRATENAEEELPLILFHIASVAPHAPHAPYAPHMLLLTFLTLPSLPLTLFMSFAGKASPEIKFNPHNDDLLLCHSKGRSQFLEVFPVKCPCWYTTMNKL